jgi:hypothetical protein
MVHAMDNTGAAHPTVDKKPKTLVQRIKAVFGVGRRPEVLVWVNTVRGPEAVPLSRLRDLR